MRREWYQPHSWNFATSSTQLCWFRYSHHWDWSENYLRWQDTHTEGQTVWGWYSDICTPREIVKNRTTMTSKPCCVDFLSFPIVTAAELSLSSGVNLIVLGTIVSMKYFSSLTKQPGPGTLVSDLTSLVTPCFRVSENYLKGWWNFMMRTRFTIIVIVEWIVIIMFLLLMFHALPPPWDWFNNNLFTNYINYMRTAAHVCWEWDWTGHVNMIIWTVSDFRNWLRRAECWAWVSIKVRFNSKKYFIIHLLSPDLLSLSIGWLFDRVLIKLQTQDSFIRHRVLETIIM